jgi:hypothetical protein
VEVRPGYALDQNKLMQQTFAKSKPVAQPTKSRGKKEHRSLDRLRNNIDKGMTRPAPPAGGGRENAVQVRAFTQKGAGSREPVVAESHPRFDD